MAKLYILSEDNIKNHTRPKTPKQKIKAWKYICITLAVFVLIENAALLYFWTK